jgi:ArsR family transcriptional regulator, arsenate/arsenite/antimonite-responsive transcriptional repressor
MSYVYVIRMKVMNKSEKFDESLQKIARIAKAMSHPARLAILKYLAESKTCISGDISDYIPLGRTTVSQHLKELKDAGLIKGEIEGLKINYCLNRGNIQMYVKMYEEFFQEIKKNDFTC